MNITINQEQRLFVLPSGGGYSCLGFDVVFKRLKQYAQRLGLTAPDPQQVGSMAQYQQYLQAESAYIKTNPTETWYDLDTPAEVKRQLEWARVSQREVRIYLGDAKTGRDWMNEYDVIGRVGRSMGPIRIPLLCGRRSHGGFAILTECVVRIQTVGGGNDLYRHPTYHLPQLEIVPSTMPGYVEEAHGVSADGSAPTVHARFKQPGRAQKWVAYMKGERMRSY